MLFNSFEFALFFLVVFSSYWFLGHRRQNQMLLVASYFFYGCWDWRFLFLLLLSTLIDYIVALLIDRTNDSARRKQLLAVSLVCSLSILGFFKYFNFFAGSLEILLSKLGIPAKLLHLNIILPVGISFYTFQSISYAFDVYRRQLKPVRNFFDFALFVSFFPQLVAGPIERATNLLPQILSKRSFSLKQFQEGCYLIFWGLFQKVYIADNLSAVVAQAFAEKGPLSGPTVLLALYAFAFQIYCDFAGYSNMARGIAKTMGFELMVNFNLPYFAMGLADFWRRWHISLSTWLKDYLYIPLGGNRKGSARTCLNLMLVMTIGGLWHGAAWTFLAWGFYHGVLLVLERIFGRFTAKLWSGVKIFAMFHLVCFGWLLFRADSLHQVGQIASALFHNWNIPATFVSQVSILISSLAVLLLVQIAQYRTKDFLCILKTPIWVRTLFYYALFYMLVIYAPYESKPFIYFQF